MTDAELNEKVARAMGWTEFPYLMHPAPGAVAWCPPGAEVHVSTIAPLPDFLHDPRAFMDLLLWHAREGRGVMVEYIHIDGGRAWSGVIWNGDGDQVGEACAPTPASALALATVAWKEAS